ncbi:hypothetical protein [Rufibacter roseolus]|uniref:hypothetical protein n=1 Tax=Rufibacter roseolus TaxID=2817375 RepID=UPI001B30B426|nr:hypothetical protein [Rufibacter roseolus]
MDDLRITISTLSPEGVKEFASFIQRHKKRKDRKDYELFKLLLQKQKLSPAQIMDRLYGPEPNPSAYYALRKRLMQHLTDFIVLKRMQEDPTADSSIMGALSMARYLFEAQADRLAWNLLRKAEHLAAAHEQFDLLNSVYNLQIERADSEFADDLDLIIKKRNQNKAAADEDERANIASSIIGKQLERSRREGRDLQFAATIQAVLQTYGLTEAVSQRPPLFFKLMSIARAAVLARRDYYTFEPYIIERYRAMASHLNMTQAHQYYKIRLLYMIAHVLYRNRKFAQSNGYLEEMHAVLQTQGRSYLTAFYPKYLFLKSANGAFQRNLPQAIQLLEELLQAKTITLPHRDMLTARMGLSFLYFAQGNFQKANNLLVYINHSDKWCERIMGREWVLKKNLGELIIQYEFGNLDLALDRAKGIRRSYKDLLSLPAYSNASSFLQLITYLIEQPDLATRKLFLQQVESMLTFVPAEQEDLQAMSFYAWLKAKMQGRRYYDVLLELAHAS